MRRAPAAAAIALGLSLACSPFVVAAQTAPGAAAGKAATKAPPRKAARPAKAAAPAPAPVPPADEDQKAAAAQAHLGDYLCEFDQTVKVEPDAAHAYYVTLTHAKQNWLMKPVLSSTGALRLEDVRGRMLMIQIANKSMVMDTQLGQRVVDGCQHEKQREFARTFGGGDAAGVLLKN